MGICKLCESSYCDLDAHLRIHHDDMVRAVYKVLAEDLPPIRKELTQSKGKRVITWGASISRAKKGQPFELAGWNKGFTKETHPSVAKIANNAVRNEKIRQAMIGRVIWWADKMAATKRKRLREDPEYVRSLFAAIGIRPNKPEKHLALILWKHFPREWKYVGAGELIIGGKNPDFANIDGKKQLIELNGEYWHQDDNPEERIEWFRKYGYDTLIIWTKELKDEVALVQKIRDFSECRDFTPTIPATDHGDKDKVRHYSKG